MSDIKEFLQSSGSIRPKFARQDLHGTSAGPQKGSGVRCYSVSLVISIDEIGTRSRAVTQHCLRPQKGDGINAAKQFVGDSMIRSRRFFKASGKTSKLFA
jgi:hypothetical protein